MQFNEKPSLDELVHYGTKRHSGRYPWGSGDEPYQRSGDFISRINELKKEGLSETEIATYFGMKTTDFRNEYKSANNERKYEEFQTMKSLKEKGYSNYKIGEIMGISESSVRSKLNPHSVAKLVEAKNTSEFLKKQIKEKGYIDVSEGVEKELGISRGKLDEALYMMQMEGYPIYNRYVDQLTNPGKQTTYKVLCPPETEFSNFQKMDVGEIKTVVDYASSDDGQSYQPKFVYPKSMDSSRLQIRYKEDGGIDKDGIVEIRRGVEDLSLGNDRYAQVRILVDGTHYIKGMAVYSDDPMPKGVDLVFNTNKDKSVSKMDVLKKIKDDPDNPFGSSIKDAESGGQHYYTDKDGNKQLSLINKRASEGDWEDWSNNLPSQFLSKQSLSLAKRQLGLAIDGKVDEYNEICSLTNPTVKKKLLESYADDCDSAAVHLKAAALPHQQYHVIIPITSLKDTEIYAPNYDNGEQVALVRYPHGGTFEIPVLTVNNKHAAAKKLLGTDIVDAVGINSKVAERLSGADFDGDTVMVIPTNSRVKITSTRPLKGLEGFDPKMTYGTHEVNGKRYNSADIEIKVMKNTQNEMGRISNLITDMTLRGAQSDEIARAVRHSMVVIDAEKHKLDYKQSELDNGIKALKDKYQRSYDDETGETTGGASTLLSRSKSQQPVLKRQGTPKINTKYNKNGKINDWYDPNKPEGSLIYKKADDLYYADRITDKSNPKLKGYRLANGKKVMYDITDKASYEYYKPVKKINEKTGDVYFTNKNGDLIYNTATRTQNSTKMAETDDAYSLISVSNTPMERLYADYANKMKSLANQARKEYMITGDIEYSASANKTYDNEVRSLFSKLNEASKNKTRERAAQLIGNSRINAKLESNPDMKKDEIKKHKDQELQKARALVGAKRKLIDITDREWEAIQSGAIRKTKLEEILKYTDIDVIRSKATPRISKSLTSAQINRIKSMISSGRYTNQEIATALGISTSTVGSYAKGKE